VPADRWFAMTRLDQNRAATQLAKKAGAPVSDVKNLAIWGNHSATQFPDFANATIGAKKAPEVIRDHAWLEGVFITNVQKRGAAIIEARGLSSAASAANAAIDTVVSLTTPTASDNCVSVGVTSHGEYGVPEGLTFGLPIIADGKGAWQVKENFAINEFAAARIKVTTDELLSERDEVRALGLI
jgi:malate dehydrogenase